MRKRILLAFTATSLLGLPFVASAITIDDFATQQSAALNFGDPGPAGSAAAAGDAIGGSREIVLERVGMSAGTASADSSLSDAGLFSLSTGAAVRATTTLTYDGTADGTTDFAGLGGASVISGGENTLRIITRSDLDTTIRVQFHSGSETDYLFTEVFVTGAGVGDGPLQIIDIPLASLSIQGAGADLGDLGAIQAFLNDPVTGEARASVDMQIDSISTIPEPGAVALMALGLSGLMISGRRRA